MLCLAFAPLAVINQRTILNETGVRIFTNDTLVALGFNCLRPCQLLPVEKTKVFSFAGLPWPSIYMLITNHLYGLLLAFLHPGNQLASAVTGAPTDHHFSGRLSERISVCHCPGMK
jgi:hypothetical protein